MAILCNFIPKIGGKGRKRIVIVIGVMFFFKSFFSYTISSVMYDNNAIKNLTFFYGVRYSFTMILIQLYLSESLLELFLETQI